MPIKFFSKLLLLLLLSFVGKSQELIIKPDIEAQFPGGTSEMYKFLGKNVKYPSAAIKANVTGRVFLTFIVSANGSIENIKILRDPGFGIGDEVVRIVKSMPKWEPGKIAGKSVRSQYNLPVNLCPE